MLYLDTSVLVAAITPEAESRRIQQWLRDLDPRNLAISKWVATEFSSALSMKLRTGALTIDQRAAAAGIFKGLAGSSLKSLAIASKHFDIAARFAGNPAAKLRGGDALHLAVAFDNDARLCTLDRRMADGGAMLGLQTLLA